MWHFVFVIILKVTLLTCLLGLSACGIGQRQINAVAANLDHEGAERALAALEKIKPDTRDQGQYLLNRGWLKRLSGDFEGSNTDLLAAKQLMDTLQATSVSESIGALTINETLRSYEGTPSERVILHQVLAFNYLQQGRLDSARVEILQADITMREIASADSLRGQLASTHFISGVIYELNNEWDNAMISYRRALEIMDQRQQPIPLALQDSLLNTSQYQQLVEEYQHYVSRFGRPAQVFHEGDKELLVFYSDGSVSNKQQHITPVFSFEHQTTLSLAIPYYPPSHYQAQHFTIKLAGQYHRTQTLENLDVLARQELEEQLPAITAATLLRVAVKYQAVKEARQKQDELAAVLLNFALLASEQADLRSWNMLPATLQIARIRIPAANGQDIDLPFTVSDTAMVNVNHQRLQLLFISSLDRLRNTHLSTANLSKINASVVTLPESAGAGAAQ